MRHAPSFLTHPLRWLLSPTLVVSSFLVVPAASGQAPMFETPSTPMPDLPPPLPTPPSTDDLRCELGRRLREDQNGRGDASSRLRQPGRLPIGGRPVTPDAKLPRVPGAGEQKSIMEQELEQTGNPQAPAVPSGTPAEPGYPRTMPPQVLPSPPAQVTSSGLTPTPRAPSEVNPKGSFPKKAPRSPGGPSQAVSAKPPRGGLPAQQLPGAKTDHPPTEPPSINLGGPGALPWPSTEPPDAHYGLPGVPLSPIDTYQPSDLGFASLRNPEAKPKNRILLETYGGGGLDSTAVWAINAAIRVSDNILGVGYERAQWLDVKTNTGKFVQDTYLDYCVAAAPAVSFFSIQPCARYGRGSGTYAERDALGAVVERTLPRAFLKFYGRFILLFSGPSGTHRVALEGVTGYSEDPFLKGAYNQLWLKLPLAYLSIGAETYAAGQRTSLLLGMTVGFIDINRP